ncbi:peroxisomal N(1)-acetyl-spermine/spermidine oxidase-like [Coccinella septempunctata]|uniref:peroxisomal N(1)-acetyl-spermine/spermidine oxidase-like n=1 Tax=Coccinella septempunctata TaxID=41139 RepID=UPI001D087F6C|nr:peroxisomal N(1)-acetyl-spermine/spermidine oxidase-like [Coccinella septempunctata]
MATMAENREEIDEDVIIIGAGAAGIAAFTKLIKYGIDKTRILEAEDRIGGRIHSIPLGDAFVDLGAEEVHGEKGNVVVQLAGEYLKKKKALTESICYFSDGRKIDQDLSDRVMDLIEDFCEDDSEVKKSIGEVFTDSSILYASSPMTSIHFHRFKNVVLKNYENDVDKMNMACSFLPLCESFFSILEGPYSWFDVILESASNYVDCEGDQFLGWNGRGCQTILDILMGKNLDFDSSNDENIGYENKISLNKAVRKIEWKQKNRVGIKCWDGSRYRAKHVIFSPSVGMLKEKHGEMFEPNLPAKKIDVLGKIGFSNVMKVALKFREKWWNEAPIALIWSKDDKEKLEKSWLTSVYWLMEAPDNTKVLVAWLTGPATPSVEKMSDDEIKNGIMQVINKFLGKYYNITEPEEIIPTRWHSNPNFRGTYSYETPETFDLEVPFQTVLEEPLTNENGVPVVLFAGEATHLTQYSTVNGAILSGFREADKIIQMYNKN